MSDIKYRFTQSLGTPAMWQLLASSLIPDVLHSEEALHRQDHTDLPELSDFRLWQELHRLEDVLAWVEHPAEWLKERYKRVQEEQKRRRGRKS